MSTHPGHTLTFAGLLLFTLVLYIRPNDLFPIGDFPVAKIIGLLTLIAFLLEGPRLVSMSGIIPRETKYVLGIAGAMVLSVPLAVNPDRALETLLDVFLKVAVIFILIVATGHTPSRLRQLMRVTVLCGTWMAYGTVKHYLAGHELLAGYRATGIVGGMFENPNDLALALNMLLPFAVGLALTSSSRLYAAGYYACAGCITAAIHTTYSRGGALTFIGVAIYLAATLGRRARWVTVLLIALGIALFASDSDTWGSRLFSVLSPSSDASGSSAQRSDLLKYALEVVSSNPKVALIGVGAGNYDILSDAGKGTHNGYLQVLVELGLPAFVLYVLFLRTAYKGLSPLTRQSDDLAQTTIHLSVMAMSIQASLVAYMIGSFFGDVAFLWYVYYPAAYAVCVRGIAGLVTPPPAALTDARRPDLRTRGPRP